MSDGQPTISLCMIVKNEAEQIRDCLKSVHAHVDQMIVVDTGSTDQTVDIATEMGAEVYHYQWTNDFAAARNVSLGYAQSEWIIFLDADERIRSNQTISLKECLHRAPSTVFALSTTIFNYASDEHHETEMSVHEQIRIFRNHCSLRFIGRVHEQLIDSTNQRPIPHPSTIKIDHFGYTPTIWQKQGKNERLGLYRDVLKETPSPFAHFNLGIHLKILKQYEEALEHLIKALDPSISHEEWWTNAAVTAAFCANELKQFELAVALADTALTYAPRLADALLRKAEALQGLQAHQRIITEIMPIVDQGDLEVINEINRVFFLPYRIGRSYFELQQFRESYERFKVIATDYCTDVTVWVHLCYCALKLWRWDDFKHWKKQGLAINSNDQDWHAINQLYLSTQAITTNYQPYVSLPVKIEGNHSNVWEKYLQSRLQWPPISESIDLMLYLQFGETCVLQLKSKEMPIWSVILDYPQHCSLESLCNTESTRASLHYIGWNMNHPADQFVVSICQKLLELDAFDRPLHEVFSAQL